MKITASKLIRWAGLAAMVAGICYVVVGIFHPPNILSSVTTTQWVIVHVLATAMCFFGILGMAGLYARQAEKSGWLGLAGFVLLSLWLVLIMGFTFAEVFILPVLVTAAPTFVEGWLGMFTGSASTMNLGALPTVWTLTGPIYAGRPAVRHRDAPRRHLAALGGRAPCRRSRVGPRGCAASDRAPAESGGAGGVSSGLAGLCALV